MTVVSQTVLLGYLDELLLSRPIQDYAPNGLQVAGKPFIKKIVSGVTACQALLDAAVLHKADAVLVHHGYFWKGESSVIIGAKKQRLKTLLQHDLNLIAYHLPLDVHPVYGNNARLAEILNLVVTRVLDPAMGLLWQGELASMMTGEALVTHIRQQLGRAPLYIPGHSPSIHRIAWCTGAGQDFIQQAIEANVDAFLTGEVSERTVHSAREAGIHFFAAGHHATERYGVQALGEHIAEQFSIQHQFIDIDNPV